MLLLADETDEEAVAMASGKPAGEQDLAEARPVVQPDIQKGVNQLQSASDNVHYAAAVAALVCSHAFVCPSVEPDCSWHATCCRSQLQAAAEGLFYMRSGYSFRHHEDVTSPLEQLSSVVPLYFLPERWRAGAAIRRGGGGHPGSWRRPGGGRRPPLAPAPEQPAACDAPAACRRPGANW